MGRADAASEVTVETIRLGLSCPLTLLKIQDLPARGRGCTHYESFDARPFLTLLSSSATGSAPCPHCRLRLQAEDLVKCDFTLGVLRSERLPEDATHIVVGRDLTWAPESLPRVHVTSLEEEHSGDGRSSFHPPGEAVRCKIEPRATENPAQKYVVSRPKEIRNHRVHPYGRVRADAAPTRSAWTENRHLWTTHWVQEQNDDFPGYDEPWDDGHPREEPCEEEWDQNEYGDDLPPPVDKTFSWAKELQPLFG